MSTDTATRNPSTWSELPQGLTPSTDLVPGWQHRPHLAAELGVLAGLTLPQAGVLVAAVRSGLPAMLTWDTPLQGGVTETKTTAVTVRALYAGNGRSDRVRIAYWGFEHDVYLTMVRDADAPSPEISYTRPAA